jgi:hypothetical protein
MAPGLDPMARPLTRIDRAKLHLDQLETGIQAFLDTNPYPTTRERDDKRRRYVWRVHLRDAPPETLGFMAADFIHNARATLDNIVWGLALPRVRRRKPSFPIYDDKVRFQCEALPMLKGMKPEIIEAIEWCQPYHGDNHIVASDRLLHLNQLWNFDKHRAPLAVGCVTNGAGYAMYGNPEDFPRLQVHMGQVLVEGKQIAWVPLHESLPDNFDASFYFGIAFEGAGRRVIPASGLRRAYDIITNEVVPAIRAAI